MKKLRQQKGFTIVELMIATSVFSVILLLASNAVIQIGRLYYKGLTTTKTQEVARNITESVTRDLQLSNSRGLVPSDDTGLLFTDTKALCIGDSRYTYRINQQVKDGSKGLWLDEAPLGACAVSDYSSGRELLGANMRLLDFGATSPDGNRTYQVRVGIAYGDNDFLSSYDEAGITLIDSNGDGTADATDVARALCRSSIAGSSFCATSSLDSVVKRRIN